MELNREQIIRALELHSQGAVACLHECPYGNLHNCGSAMARDTLSLIKELTEENERLSGAVKQYEEERKYHFEMSRTRIAEAKADTVRKMQELNDEVVKKYMEERSVFLEERKNVGEGDGAFWYIQGRIDGMEWVADTVRFTKNEMIDQIAKEMLEDTNES